MRLLLRRLLVGTAISAVMVLVPLAGNPAMLHAAHPWLALALGILASALQPDYNPFTIANRRGDRGTGAQIVWTVYLTQVGAILEATFLRYPGSVAWDAVAVAALAAAGLGLFVRTWAVFTLGAFFTMHIAVHPGQRIVRTGPFAMVRHPSYLGALLLYLAIPVFLHAWIAMAAALILLPAAFVRRIRVEEGLLRTEFGAEYEGYCAKVRRLLPGIW